MRVLKSEVVSDQPNPAVTGTDAGGAIVKIGSAQAVRHGRARCTKTGDVKPSGNRHGPEVLNQRAVARLGDVGGGAAHTRRERCVGSGGGHHLGADAEAGYQLGAASQGHAAGEGWSRIDRVERWTCTGHGTSLPWVLEQ